MISKEQALRYHSEGRKGKIEVVSTKPRVTQTDLSLAYTPGVAELCREIHESPDKIWVHTSRGNLVAVVSNGTAVLGLGDIGADAGKPVMEGKGVLFKRFADIDVFDLELNSHEPDEIIRAVQLMEPTFGGINLEDIKAPECFTIEETLKKTMKIPVFHDDQHGTAIISGAALLNALEIIGKDIRKVKVVFNGAGASRIACANYYLSLGVERRNLILCDTKGVVYAGRKDGMNPYKAKLAAETKARTLAEAVESADVFVGLSGPNVFTKALANLAKEPVPYSVIKAYRLQSLKFGRDYIIPKPFDPRVLLWVAPAVAKAAMDSGVAQHPIDLEKYREELEGRLGVSRKFMRVMINKAKAQPKRIVYPEGDLPAILKACEIVLDEGMAHPILLGDEKLINSRIEEMRVPLHGGVVIINALTSPKLSKYIDTFYELRKRKGLTRRDAEEAMKHRHYFGPMMVYLDEADGMVAGLTKHYPDTLRPALQIIKLRAGVSKVAGLYAMVFKEGVYFIADATVNIEPGAEDLAGIAILAAQTARRFNIEPRVALLSFSNFGSVKHPLTEKAQHERSGCGEYDRDCGGGCTGWREVIRQA